MNKYCVPLSITENIFNNINPFELPKERHFKLNIDQHLSNEIKNIFRSLKLEIMLVEVFYSKPSLVGGIHADSFGGDFTKINWIFGGKNSTMVWYETKDSTPKPSENTPVESNYISYDINEVNQIYETSIVKPSLVQVFLKPVVCLLHSLP